MKFIKIQENSSIAKLNSFLKQIVTNLNNSKFKSMQQIWKISKKISKIEKSWKKFKIIQKPKIIICDLNFDQKLTFSRKNHNFYLWNFESIVRNWRKQARTCQIFENLWFLRKIWKKCKHRRPMLFFEQIVTNLNKSRSK